MLFNSSKNPTAAKSLLQALFAGDYYQNWITAAGGYQGGVFLKCAQYPLWNDPLMKAVMDMVQYSHTTGWPGPITSWSVQSQNQYLPENGMGMIIQGTPIDKAVTATAAKMQQLYDQYK